MISCRPRPYARWLAQYNRFQIRSGSSSAFNSVGGAAPSSPPSSSLLPPPSSLCHFHHSRPWGVHRTTSSFGHYLARTRPSSNDHSARVRDDVGERRGRRDGNDDARGGWDRGRTTTRDNGNDPRDEHRDGRRPRRPPDRGGPRHRSARLIGEPAARRTTDLFLEAHSASSSSSSASGRCRSRYGDGETAPPWKDAAALVAAEQALEFWAHRNNKRNNNHHRDNNNNNNKQRHRQSYGGERFDKANSSSAPEGDAETAFRLFAALHHFHVHGGGGVLTNGMYSHVIDALARSPNTNHVDRADALLRQFITLYVERRAGGGANVGKDPTEPTPAQSVPSPPLEIPVDIQWNVKDDHHFPNQIRITGVMRGHARAGRPGSAESLLALMTSHSVAADDDRDDERRKAFRPNEVGFATVVDAYSRARDGPNAERVLGAMKGRSFRTGAALGVDEASRRERGGLGSLPHANGANVVAYNAAIGAWARSAKAGGTVPSSRAAADRAERLLREMWREHEAWSGRRGRNPKNLVLPDVVTYSTVISAYASCLDQPHGAERARELLSELEELAAREFDESRPSRDEDGFSSDDAAAFGIGGGGRNPHGFRPNTTVYNALLQAHANAGDARAAEGLLGSMVSLHSSSLEEGGGGPYRHVRPNTRTFNVVLNAWAKRGGGEAGTKAEEILDRLEGMASDGDGPARPDVISYNTVLAAWSKSAGVAEEGRPGVVGKDAAYRALELLGAIEERRARSRDDGRDDRRSRVVGPDAVSYNTTIAAFANAARTCEDGVPMAKEAQAVLSRMKDRSGIEPDAYSHNGVLLAWARSSGGLPAARRAESILRSMRDPSAISWSTVIGAYAHADGATRAEALLGEMERDANPSRRNEGDGRAPIAPSTAVYNVVLLAWGRSADADASGNAERLLRRMEDASAAGPSTTTPAPDAVSYRSVLAALERGRDPDKAARARDALDRMLARGAGGPDDVRAAYNCVLTSCAYTPADAGERCRADAARILVETLRDVNRSTGSGGDGVGPDQESYALFLQGCVHLFKPGSEERSLLSKSAFRECCRKGLLNGIIWDKFRSAMAPESVETFMGEIAPGSWTELRYENLPGEWSHNSPQTSRG